MVENKYAYNLDSSLDKCNNKNNIKDVEHKNQLLKDSLKNSFIKNNKTIFSKIYQFFISAQIQADDDYKSSGLNDVIILSTKFNNLQ